MNYIATFVMIFGLASGCATPKQPVLDRDQALRLGLDYAKEEQWDIKRIWESVTFNRSTREWEMLFDTTQNGGPMIVFVNDETRKVRFESGE
jgi:hypothetical protein